MLVQSNGNTDVTLSKFKKAVTVTATKYLSYARTNVYENYPFQIQKKVYDIKKVVQLLSTPIDMKGIDS